MTSDLDIYRAAQVLIDQHGASARHEAVTRAFARLARGDRQGWAEWRRVIAAIEDLQAKEAAQPVH